jgi:hypothetical protein
MPLEKEERRLPTLVCIQSCQGASFVHVGWRFAYPTFYEDCKVNPLISLLKLHRRFFINIKPV